MATARQIAANRANAQKSSGPKTAAGRARSSRNALRHGLSARFSPDPTSEAQVEALIQAIVGSGANAESVEVAKEIAEAHVELMHIRRLRAATAAGLDLGTADPQALARLQGLDRYERLAHTKRRRALKNSPTAFYKTNPIEDREIWP